VRFGSKTIEVATFRRHVLPGTENEPATEPTPGEEASHDLLIRHDNTFGTPEEDAFRRDFTINALFYDLATFSIIDYVGGLGDLRQRIVRAIGDPGVRFQEDPVRMFRAVALAARLGFTLDRPVLEGIQVNRPLLARAAPARLIEEYYKVLRSGAAETTFRMLGALGLLETITPELHRPGSDARLWQALGALDRYRQRFDTAPPALSNPILLGTLLVPLGLVADGRAAARESPVDLPAGRDHAPRLHVRHGEGPGRHRRRGPKEPPLRIGLLPVARRDTEMLRQILAIERRLMDLESSPRVKRSLMHRGLFPDALVWLEIHGRSAEALEHWRGFIEADSSTPREVGGRVPRRRRRGRRRRRVFDPHRRG
jgi:poly(A) polymerase